MDITYCTYRYGLMYVRTRLGFIRSTVMSDDLKRLAHICIKMHKITYCGLVEPGHLLVPGFVQTKPGLSMYETN